MKRTGVGILTLFYYINSILCQNDIENDLMATKADILEPQNFVNWPWGNIPFFINPEHFDNEQTLIIMTSLSLIAFKTCLKFAPVMVPPADKEHVLTFENPRGTHKCEINLHGHPRTEPHVVTLGYDCLEAPWMDRIVLRALGLPFEHNRQSRDTYIDVQYENIEQHLIPLFTKDIALPAALRALPYDINSVMHFGDRDYSKNGHRTIIFKDRDFKQRWNGPSDLDLRKIEIIYGAECRERDRQEKIELCHMYPGVPLTDRKRRKRSVDLETTRSLRVNPDITPPPPAPPVTKSSPRTMFTSKLKELLTDLDIEQEADKIVEDVYKLSIKALDNTREKYCNTSKENQKPIEKVNDIHGVIQLVADYAQDMIDHAIKNISSFCDGSESLEKYLRQCRACQKPFYSTKHGVLYKSTKHGFNPQSTKHVGGPSEPPFYPQYSLREDDNAKPQNETKGGRRKRQAVGTAIRRQVKRLSESDSEIPDGTTKAYREHKTALKKKRNPLRRGQSDESEQDEQSSEERDEKNIRPAFNDSENSEDSDSSKNKRNPKNSGRDGQTNKKPVMQNSGSEDTISTEEERSDERNGKKKRRPTNIASESEETEHLSKTIKRSPGKVLKLSKENEEFYNQRKWPNGVVRYIIIETSTNFDIQDLRRRLTRVNASLTKHTCVYIEEIKEDEASKFPDYLVLDNSPDFVTGKVGGRQIFGTPELLKGGQHRQHAAMMVMAMLGFYFELSRHDRDNYVKVHSRHIRADKLHHFEKIGAEATLPLPYDYESATHPPWMFWRKLGKRGISSVATFKDKDPDGSIMKSLGQNRRLLSETDITKINSVYGVKCMVGDETINQPNSEWEDDI